VTTLDLEVVDHLDDATGKDGSVAGHTAASRLAKSRARYDKLAAELADVGIIAAGSLALRSHRCGKANCACMADPPRLHGPYWHLTTKVAGKTVNRRLNETEALAYREWIDNGRRLRALIEELRRVGQEVIELTLSEKTHPSGV
jgi:hypothetical protein